MAKDETAPETTPEATQVATPEETPATAPEPAPEQVYSLSELKENAMAIFGVQSEVIAGALYGNSKQEFTVSELQKLINTFLRKKVK